MSLAVCLAPPATLSYPDGGGHLWVGLNWALGLRDIGCRVLWLETVKSSTSHAKLLTGLRLLKERLQPYGLADRIVVANRSGSPLPSGVDCLGVESVADVDLLISIGTSDLDEVVRRVKRSAFIDIDPGLLQIWADAGQVKLSRYDTYFSIGETVGRPSAGFPDLGLEWNYTPPCVSLAEWRPHSSPDEAPLTTVAHWHADAWIADGVSQTKRDGFLPFVDLPRRTAQPLELALDLTLSDPDRTLLQERGWSVRDARAVAGTPSQYQSYIQSSRGEFSCAKPSCMRLQNAWVSDRTLCYLASGKPAVVQHTGPSRILPDAAGVFRFQTLDEAAAAIEQVVDDYPAQSRLARELAEECFDATKVVRGVLDRAL